MFRYVFPAVMLVTGCVVDESASITNSEAATVAPSPLEQGRAFVQGATTTPASTQAAVCPHPDTGCTEPGTRLDGGASTLRAGGPGHSAEIIEPPPPDPLPPPSDPPPNTDAQHQGGQWAPGEHLDGKAIDSPPPATEPPPSTEPKATGKLRRSYAEQAVITSTPPPPDPPPSTGSNATEKLFRSHAEQADLPSLPPPPDPPPSTGSNATANAPELPTESDAAESE